MIALQIPLILLTLVCATFANAAVYLPKHSPVPGGIAQITLHAHRPTMRYRHRRLLVVKSPPHHWTALVGIPLNARAGQERVTMLSPIRQHYRFTVAPKRYPHRKITIRNQRKVKPKSVDRRRIRRERRRIKRTLATYTTNITPLQTEFIRPVKGRITSAFGVKRLYNKQLRSQHTGLDLAAKDGTPIRAPAGGKVRLTGNFFYTGNTIYLDHGRGLISVFAHLQQIDVKVGQTIRPGQHLGTAGHTGRVTGPHLHWGVYLNRTPVNPMLFLDPSRFVH